MSIQEKTGWLSMQINDNFQRKNFESYKFYEILCQSQLCVSSQFELCWIAKEYSKLYDGNDLINSQKFQ